MVRCNSYLCLPPIPGHASGLEVSGDQGNYRFDNLKIEFKDGFVAKDGYSCTNFDSEDENQKYIEEKNPLIAAAWCFPSKVLIAGPFDLDRSVSEATKPESI